MRDLAAIARRWAEIPRIYTVKVSGDGAWVFWSWEAKHQTAEIYCAPADGSGEPQRLTRGSDHFYLRDVDATGARAIVAQSRHGSEHDRLLLLERATGVLTELTPAQSGHYVYGGRFTADGKAMIFIADFDYVAGKVCEGGWIWQQDLASGARRLLLATRSSFTEGPELSPDGSRMLWLRHERAPGGDQLWVMGSDGAEPREVFNPGDKARMQAVWLDDRRIAIVADTQAGSQTGVLDAGTGTVAWHDDVSGLDPWVIVAGTAGDCACVAYRQSRLEPWLMQGGKRQAFPNPSGRRSLLPVAALPDGSWIAEAYDADAAHELVRIMAEGGLVRLASVPRARAFARPRDWRWTSPDGTPVQGWLYQPSGPSRGLVVWVHGGPTWHSEDWVNPKVQFWVRAGYTVLDPNYRGSTGFGMAFREAVKIDGWGGREQEDIRSGILSLLDAGLAERGKIAVIGLSYGGYSAWVAITRFADLVTAAVPICGMYRLDIDYHATEMPHGRDYSKEMMGGTPEQQAEKYHRASPGNFIEAIRGSLMIVHGLADSNVGPENTRAAVRELTAKGIDHEVLWFEDEGHGVTKQANLQVFMRRTAEFLDKAFGA